jgi:hypothetical protein
MSRRRSIASLTLLAVIGLASASASVAMAQPAGGATAAAEALFQEGRALLMAGKTEEACPKLEESQRLDPATGTLLALALCHEQQGKLASAWAAFADIEARSRLDGRADRERTAREHGAALRPRLSTLTLAVSEDARNTPALVISIDGVPIGRPAWNAALPIDGGAHIVEAAIPGRSPWKASVSIKSERDQVRLLVLVPAVPPADPGVSRANALGPTPIRRGGARRVVGLAAVGAGIIGLGASALLGLDARSDYRAATALCAGGVCPPDPYARVQASQDQGDLATALAIVSGAAVATGAALWWWSQSAGAHPHAASAAGAQLGVSPGGLAISGRF